MKCEHCGYDAPERAVICPECGEILPRPKKAEEEETEKAAVQKKTAPDADSFSMPFLSAPADLEKADGIAAEDPEVLRRQKQEKTTRLTRRIVAAAVAAAVVLAAVLYYVFFGGYKLAVYRYVKGVDRESGSMYVALVPDAYMDYLETTYSTTRREVKSMIILSTGTKTTGQTAECPMISERPRRSQTQTRSALWNRNSRQTITSPWRSKRQ